MSIESTADRQSRPSARRGFWTWLKAVEEAVETSYDDIQDRRILALELEVASLRAAFDAGASASAEPSSVAPR